MKRFIHLLYWLAVAVLLSAGCNKKYGGDDFLSIISHSYVTWFMRAETSGAQWYPESSSVAVYVTGHEYERNSPASDSLNNLFGDTSFDNLLSYSDQHHFYLSEEFTAIEVTSDRDFDAAHPAGSSLSDIVMFYGISAYPYIKSGYDDRLITPARKWLRAEFSALGLNGNYFGRFGDKPIKKLLKDLAPDDLKLLAAPVVLLRFTAPPSAGNHTFTVTFRSPEKTLVSTLAVEIQ